MRNLALPAQKAGRSDLLALWAGQSANLVHSTDIQELLQSLVEGAAERLN
jgi:nitronate monooxygenase